jgi:hypothetical protein
MALRRELDGAREFVSDIANKGERAEREALAPSKKRAGRKPCSKNCVDPISPQIWI